MYVLDRETGLPEGYNFPQVTGQFENLSSDISKESLKCEEINGEGDEVVVKNEVEGMV